MRRGGDKNVLWFNPPSFRVVGASLGLDNQNGYWKVCCNNGKRRYGTEGSEGQWHITMEQNVVAPDEWKTQKTTMTTAIP